MSFLVIPDVHEQADKVRRILDLHGKDGKVVFLGDFFDSFVDGGRKATLRLISDLLADERFVILLGNHDAHYVYPNDYLRCSGFKRSKANAIRQSGLRSRWAERAKLWVDIDGWRLSHAGFSPYILEKVEQGPLTLEEEWLRCQEWMLLGKNWNTPLPSEHLPSLGDVPILAWVGRCRGGLHYRGGPMWLDWNNEFEPIAGLNQIVGHTTGPEPRWVCEYSNNLNLDTGLGHVAKVHGPRREDVEIISIPD